MQSFKLIDGDIVFNSSGDLEMIDGDEELAQCCDIALGTNTGEWFLNPEMGIDFSLFLGKHLSEEQMRDEINRGLLQEERISSVNEIVFNPDEKSRVMEVSFVATKADGEGIQSEVKIGAD
ncbi:DUF2634 domain-containing protein [Paenibacillus sp. VCA1]|uniref:DUF2634 domain-containing protein n=1 Tax=Paenibacillus sp. VCA1 TaxID=3039148 RepID=UPI0028726893|nr:DUF2634 domain-containing protein [Paenibacillus sp. VCA1]MDR9857880.1 DUF2634 domain-containing protein [Paenibacillus sp. VCA1]